MFNGIIRSDKGQEMCLVPGDQVRGLTMNGWRVVGATSEEKLLLEDSGFNLGTTYVDGKHVQVIQGPHGAQFPEISGSAMREVVRFALVRDPDDRIVDLQARVASLKQQLAEAHQRAEAHVEAATEHAETVVTRDKEIVRLRSELDRRKATSEVLQGDLRGLRDAGDRANALIAKVKRSIGESAWNRIVEG